MPAPAPAPKRRWGNLLWVAGIAGIAVLAWLALRQSPLQTTGSGGPGVLKTAVVTSGKLERTIRLAGVTVAEKAATLTAPQLRGGRGGVSVTAMGMGGGGMAIQVSVGGGGGGGGGGRGGGGSAPSGGGGGGGGGSSGAGSSGSSADSASTVSALSTSGGMGGATGGAGAGSSMASFRGASNRFGSSSSSSSSPASSSSSASATSSSARSSSSGGSSGGSRGGSYEMGGFGGGMDFMQVIHSIVPAGTMVQKGQLVAEFDTQYQLLRLEDYRTTVQQAETNLRALDAEIEAARKSREQQIAQARAAVEKAKLDIKTIPVLSEIQAETLKLQLEEAEANLKQVMAAQPFLKVSDQATRRNTELSIEQNKSELKRAETNIERMKVTAPMSGMVVMQSTMRGTDFSQIRQGDQLFPGQSFAQIVDPSSMMVSAKVNQADVEFIRVGARATLHFDAYPGLTLPARVTAIAAMSNPGGMRAAFVREVPVFLKIERMDPRVIPDLSVSADVVIDEAPSLTLAPLESVFRDSPDGRPYVYVRTANGFEKREVELSLRNNTTVGVSSGLKPGEVVALEKPPEKKPGNANSPGKA
jgi:multidrug efflux pump subunit AcrA (membrane-fusion protein)